MRHEQHSSNLSPCSCLPQSKLGQLPRQPQSHVFHSNKAGKESHCTEGVWLKWSLRRRREWKINQVLKKFLKKKKKQALWVSAVTHSLWWDLLRLASLKRPNITPPSRLCLSHFTTKPHSKHLIKPSVPFFFTHCALLSDILVKYPWYFCNTANLIKGGGFPIKPKWQIAVPGLFRSLFNQRIAE